MNNPELESIRKEMDNLTADEKKELVLYLISDSDSPKYIVKETDLSKYYGTIHFPVDGVEFQNQVRSEWD